MRTDKDSKLLNIYVPLFLFLTGFIWKLFFINHRDICLDEPYTIFNAQRSIVEILKIPAEGEPNPPLFMLLLHFWIKLFGIDALSVRFLPLLFNAVTIVFLYFTGKRFLSFWAGLVASGLFIFSTYHFFHGLEARTYSFFSMATAASLYYYLDYVRDFKSRKALAGLILSNILLVYSHYFGWFVVFSQFLTSFIYIRNMKMFFRFMIPPLATVVGFSPMIPVILRQFEYSGKGTWLNPPQAYEYMDQIYHFLNNKEIFREVLYIMAIGLVLTIFSIVRKKWKGFNPVIAVLFVWWIVPYSIMFLVSSEMPMFNSRYILFNTIGLYLFIGAIISFLYRDFKYLEPLAGMIILMFMSSHLKILPDDFGHREWKKSVDFVKSNENQECMIVLSPKWSDYMFAYHYDRKLFEDYQHFNIKMAERSVYSIWGQHGILSLVAGNPDSRIIYLQDGGSNPGEDIFGLLDSTYLKVADRIFPEAIHIGVYDPK
jgi:mannosyltransferase